MEEQIIIAIDGFSSSGKGTLAKVLAQDLGYIYVDSGAMYRAATLCLLEHDIPTDNEELIIKAIPSMDIDFRVNEVSGKSETWLNGECVERKIRQMWVSEHVSAVSKIKEVRVALVEKQREFGKRKGIVMDGRDIGTVVFPDAELKLFLVADAEERAKRRFKELIQKNEAVSYEQVLHNITERDRIDMTREESPLRKADDAMEIDTTYMTIDQMVALSRSFVKQKVGAGEES